MKQVAEHRGGLVRVPVVLKPVVVPIPLPAVPVEASHVAVAIGITESYEAPPKPPSLECSWDCIAFGI